MQVVKTAIDAGKAEKLMGLNALFDADHNDVLLSVILYAYHYFTKEREISVLLEGHGRNEFDAELRIERTIGWFTCMYPVVFEGLNSDPDDMFFRTRDTLHRIPENGLAYQVLYDVESQKLPVITFNYLGEMSEKSKNTMFALNFREDTAPMIDPENEYGTDLTVNGLSLEGELIFEIGYNRKRFSEKQMEEFVFAVRDGIQRLTDVLSKRTGFDKSPADYGIDIPFDEFSLVRKEYHDKKMRIEGIEEITGEQYRNIIRQIMGIDLSVGTKSAVIEIEGNVSREVMKSSIEEIYAKRKELRTIVLHANSGKMYAVTTDLKPDIKYFSVKPHDQREAFKELMAIRHDFERASYRISEDSPARFLFVTTDTGFTYIVVSINPVLEPYHVYFGILQELLFLMDEKTGGKTNLGEWAEMIKEIAEIRMEKNHEKDDVLAVERKIERILNGIFDGTDNSGEEEKIEDIFTATLLSHKLYDRFRRSVLPIEIMRASGLRGIGELLREKKDRKPKDLYVFQNDKGLKKIILVHTMNMGSEAYVPLAGKLKGRISLAAFEQYNLIHPYHKIHGIRNIASKYIELLKEFQPEGPYTLGGWCYGGLIAYEMAYQLKERGEAVEEVILFDTHIIDDPVIKEELLTKSKEHVRNYLMNDPLFEDARRKGIIEQLIQNDNFAMSEWISYDPAPYDGKVLYFKALQRADNLKDYQNNMYDYIFSEYAAGFERRVPKEKLTVIPVPTEHDSMMNEDALKVIVPYLRGDNE